MMNPDVEQAVPSFLSRSDSGGVCRIVLDRPDAYNALCLGLMEELVSTLEEIDRDPAVKVVVVEGAGRGFCAGHDLKEMRANPDPDFRSRTFETCSQMMLAITRLRQPVIAKVHGIATAAGCQLVATCDLALAADDARFGTPGVNIGLFCSTPMVALSRAVHPKRAMEMLLTGEMIGAQRAAEIGLINRSVPEHALEEEVATLAALIAEKSGLVLKTGKEAFYAQAEMSLADAYAHCAQVMVDNMAFEDAGEGIAAFVEKRKPIWRER